MTKYLNAETVKKELDSIGNIHPGIISAIKSIIDDIPAENVKEVKHGKWIKPSSMSQEICSNCNKRPMMTFGILPDYCPWCGADMAR